MTGGGGIYIPRPGERDSAPRGPRANRDWKRDLRVWWREVDRWLLLFVVLLMLVGTLAVAAASPVTMLQMPGGIPARSASTASARAENGVSLAGRITPGHPAAQPGPALRVIIAVGKFQGVIAANTPMGSLVTMILRPRALVGITSP